jgi:hypothetical protein
MNRFLVLIVKRVGRQANNAGWANAEQYGAAGADVEVLLLWSTCSCRRRNAHPCGRTSAGPGVLVGVCPGYRSADDSKIYASDRYTLLRCETLATWCSRL